MLAEGWQGDVADLPIDVNWETLDFKFVTTSVQHVVKKHVAGGCRENGIFEFQKPGISNLLMNFTIWFDDRSVSTGFRKFKFSIVRQLLQLNPP